MRLLGSFDHGQVRESTEGRTCTLGRFRLYPEKKEPRMKARPGSKSLVPGH